MIITLKIKDFKRFSLTFIIALVAATCVSAQDKMAALAPSDIKMKAVDTLILHKLRSRENTISPATALYDEWSNKSVARYEQEIPETYSVDLRRFAMPTTSRVVTSNYGRRWGRMHKGIDVKVYTGDTIVSAFEGKVRIVGYEAHGYGKYIVIRHKNGLETVYGHLSKHLVIENQTVRAGQPIGLGGNTGRSTGSHLHFETRLLGVAINPAFMFDFVNQDVKADRYLFRRSEHIAQAGSKRAKAAQKPVVTTPQQVVQNPVTAANNSNIPAASQPVASAQQTPSKGANTHVVKRGDTLYSIATKNGMTVEQLCSKNDFPTSHILRAGETLRLD